MSVRYSSDPSPKSLTTSANRRMPSDLVQMKPPPSSLNSGGKSANPTIVEPSPVMPVGELILFGRLPSPTKPLSSVQMKGWLLPAGQREEVPVTIEPSLETAVA